MSKEREISFTQELLRKGIHLISLSIPVIYIFVDKRTALYILVPLTIFAIAVDLLSKFRNPVRFYLYKYFRRMLRSHETQNKLILNGASWVLISATLCVLVFPKLLTVVSFTILIISDISAALIGRKYGKHPIFVGKSLEGTLAFIVTAVIVVFVYGIAFAAPWTYFVAGIIAAILGGLIEAISPILKIDDNLSIPVGIGFILWGLGIYAASSGIPFLHLIN
jgi:dolichol kinase